MSVNSYVVLDQELIKKTAGGLYLKMMMELKKEEIPLTSFARKTDLLSTRYTFPEQLLAYKSAFEIYQKIQTKIKRKLKVKAKLVMLDPPLKDRTRRSYSTRSSPVLVDAQTGEKLDDNQQLKYISPIWVTEIELAPYLRKISEEVVTHVVF